MKISGHTLGTPGMTVEQALHLFHEAGIQAAEIIWQDDYPAAIPQSNPGQVLPNIRRTANDLGMEIAGLTPYMSGFNSLDAAERQQDIDLMKRCIDTAAELDCHRIRVYAGSYKPGDSHSRDKWQRLVESLQELGEHAGQSGVILCAENHFNTMTVSALETRELMEAVDHPAVGILYDQANLVFTYKEPYEQAISLQQAWIRHVHVKDLVFTDPGRPFMADEVARVKAEDRAIRSRMVGDGVLDWPAILRRLRDTGYDDYLSLEYEYRWHPQDLPEPAQGFKTSADRVRRILEDLEEGAL